MNRLINQPVIMHSGVDIEENINPFMNNILQRSMDEEPKDKPCSKEFINKLTARHGEEFNWGVRYYKGRSIILWDTLRDFRS